MRKTKKLLCLVLVVCFVATFIAGCGSSSNTAANASTAAGDTTAAPAATEAAASTAASLAPVTLTWYLIGNGQPPEQSAVDAEVSKYLKDKLNVTLKMTTFSWGDDFEQKMQAKIASNEEFDITFTCNWAANYPINAAKGAFVDLTPMLDQYAPDAKKALGDAAIKGASINGHLYAMPTLKEMAHNWGFEYLKDVAAKDGVDMSSVKKFEDIEPILKTIKEKEGGKVYPFGTTVGESPFRLLDFEKIADDDVPGAIYPNSTDCKVIDDFMTPEAKALFTTLHKWYQAGYIRKDADTVTDFSADLKAGKTFALIRSLKPGKDAEDTLAYGQKIGQVDLTTPYSTTREMIGSMNAVSKSSKNPERALMFLNLLYSDKTLNNMINFGLEGKHYVKVDDNTIDFAPETQNGTKSGYNPGNPWRFGSQFLNYLFKSEDPKKWDNFKAYNASAKVSPIIGFEFNVEPVKTQIAALKNIKKQYMPGLETGKSDPNVVLPQFEAKMKAAGLDDVLKEMQKQVDEFKASAK